MPTTQISKPSLSYSLVLIQFTMIGLLLFQAPWLASNAGLALQLAGIILGLWALQTMHLGRFNIIPDPKTDARLIQTGPYRFIRHPMYSSILLFFAPLVIQHPSPERWLIFGILCLDLWIKLHYEESLLLKKFAAYAEYQQRSKKIIPFIY